MAQLGARRHYAIPAILESGGILESFITDIHAESRPVQWLSKLIPRKLFPSGLTRLKGRVIRNVPADKIRDFPSFGLQRILKARTATSTGAQYAAWYRDNRKFCQLVNRRGFGNANIVYVFNGAGLEMMSRAKELGLHCIMEQTAADQAYDEQLLADERKLWPDWESTVVTESDYRSMADRERQERTLADLIVCGSEYVRKSLATVGEDVTRCCVVPYGFTSEATPPSRQPRQNSLNVLFAGTLCLRKGVQYLVKVASDTELTGAMQFRAVGPSLISSEAESQVRAVIDWRGPVPRSEMRSHYEWADVLVLPTISEGSANVCYEALHAGLPVITTPNAGSVVRNGIEGFVIPIRNSEQLKERLLQLSQQLDLREAMGKAATERAKEFTWEKYATRLLDAIRGMNLG